MKRRKKKIVYEAAGLLLALMFIVGTGLQSTTVAKSITDNNSKEKDTTFSKDFEKFYVFGKGTLQWIWPVNTDNFIGDQWNEEYNAYINGQIEETNLYVENFPSMGGSRYYFLFVSFYPLRVYVKLILPKNFQIVDFTGEIDIFYWNVPHGPNGCDFVIKGYAKDIQSI